MSTEETIKQQIESNNILLYMKGNPEQPQCGFSAQVTQLLMSCGQRFAYVDILSNPDIRSTLPKVSNWPTFPQLYIDGELVGGCDIITDLHEKGELQALVDAAGKGADENAAENADSSESAAE
ncbi:MAG: monothiol glutaredoxin, Grx4 family [SAR86 cluster bacterium]|uniref:Glutaredoxin n=1 Tax=SAR86 cluster bacterium TaxID=2030880 RepID=A0A2A4MNT3_9GAMM|nr:MAG: monothiol glutaredoxin, Grx4 family [SAR86 cluster bacterium]